MLQILITYSINTLSIEQYVSWDRIYALVYAALVSTIAVLLIYFFFFLFIGIYYILHLLLFDIPNVS